MTEATTKAKTAKYTGPPFDLPNTEIPKINLPKMEVPAPFRDLAAKGVAQVRDNCEKVKAATGKATDRLKDAYTTATKGATDYNLKVMEIARTNTNSAIDDAHELLGGEVALGFCRAIERTVRGDNRADQGAHRARPKGNDRNRR